MILILQVDRALGSIKVNFFMILILQVDSAMGNIKDNFFMILILQVDRAMGSIKVKFFMIWILQVDRAMGNIKVNFFMILILQVDRELQLVGYCGAVSDVAALLQYGPVQARILVVAGILLVLFSQLLLQPLHHLLCLF